MKFDKNLIISLLILTAVVIVQFANPSSVYAAGTTVGTGTSASCDEAALTAALSGGGSVDFDCGLDPVTIPIASTITIAIDTQINGGGLITIDGGGDVGGTIRLFVVDASKTLGITGLTLSGGNLDVGTGGGAIYISAGATVNITDSTFSNNKSNVSGGGGAIYNLGTLDINGSTFTQNEATFDGADGGAILSEGR